MRSLLVIVLSAGVSSGQQSLPAGMPVSRPLQPVQLSVPAEPLVADPPVEPEPEAIEVPEVLRGSSTLKPRHWSSYDLLLWWSKSQPLPPLVIGAGGVGGPADAQPAAAVLAGGGPAGQGVYTGFRFTYGWQLSDTGDSGFEFTGMFLGTNTSCVRVGDAATAVYPWIARPYTDAFTGLPAALVVAGPGVGSGGVEVKTTTRVQGWEINGLRNLVDAGDVTVAALAGYRYFAANEGLHVAQTSLRFEPGMPPHLLWNVYDQFDARNNFHGGQIGLRIDGQSGRWLLTLAGKVAFGTNFQTVRVSGSSSASTAALPLPSVQPFDAGFLALATNSGRATHGEFAVLPEARLNLGYRVGDSCHFFLGYDFMYLSSAVRPGDQVDLVIDPARSPILGEQPRIAVMGPSRPRQPFAVSDFWVQGLVLGLDCRY